MSVAGPGVVQAKPYTQRFRRASNAVNLTPDQRRRQAAVMQSAWRHFGSREAVMTFFNTYSDALGGRPLDLAIDSDVGLAHVGSHLLSIPEAGAVLHRN